MGFIFFVEKDFENIPWRDRNAATNQIHRGKGIIYENPSITSLQPIVNDLHENGRFGEGGDGDGKGGTLEDESHVLKG